MEKIQAAAQWGQTRNWAQGTLKRQRLRYLESILAGLAVYSSQPHEGPDDISPFGKSVYLKDMSTLELREYLLSGLSQEEQSAIFSDSSGPEHQCLV